MTPREIAGLWVLLWSPEQNGFHIEQLSDTFRSNASAFARNRSSAFHVLYVSENQDELDRLIDKLTPIIQTRETLRQIVREGLGPEGDE